MRRTNTQEVRCRVTDRHTDPTTVPSLHMCAEGNERTTMYKSSVSVRKHSRKNTPELNFTVAVSYPQWLCLLWNCTNCGFALDNHENPPVLPSLVTIYQDSIIALLNPPLAKTQSFLSHSLHQHVVPGQWE